MSIATIGSRFECVLGAPAHGGFCDARADNLVVFVRGGLPGERVLVEVVALGPKGRSLRAVVVEVIDPSPDRIVPPCPVATPAGCGGCDWLHARPAAATGFKTAVVREAFARFAGIELPAEFAVAAPAPSPLGWRTRARLGVDQAGRAGLRRWRSNEILPVADCPQLVAPLRRPDVLDHLGASIDGAYWFDGERTAPSGPAQRGLFTHKWTPGSEVIAVASNTREVAMFEAGRPPAAVTELVLSRSFLVGAAGFWQVHPRAAELLVEAVTRALRPRGGESLIDLYSGVGLFGLSLVPPVERLTLVESVPAAVKLARRNSAADMGTAGAVVDVVQARVEDWVRSPRRADLVVLDPPRAGAGRAVVEAVARMRARAIVYVACDPVALARDTAHFVTAGYRMDSLEAFDLFGATHHVECVAAFTRDS